MRILAIAVAALLMSPSADTGFALATPVGGVTISSMTLGQCGGYYYRNARGNCVPRPVRARQAPSGATAKCWDGTYSFSQSRRGTCSHHGGVATWL